MTWAGHAGTRPQLSSAALQICGLASQDQPRDASQVSEMCEVQLVSSTTKRKSSSASYLESRIPQLGEPAISQAHLEDLSVCGLCDFASVRPGIPRPFSASVVLCFTSASF